MKKSMFKFAAFAVLAGTAMASGAQQVANVAVEF